ncbi:unnamed protein product, partial [Mesorhabditis spiculigera]
MHFVYKLALLACVAYFVTVPFVDACQSSHSSTNSSNTTGRKKREASQDVIVVLITTEVYDASSTEAALQVFKDELTAFARQQNVPKTDKTITTEAVNVAGNFAAKFTVKGGDCEKASGFVQKAVDQIDGVSGGIVTCATGNPKIFQKKN